MSDISTHVLVTGSSGLIGQALVKKLTEQGYQVSRLLRSVSSQQPYWNIQHQLIELNGITPDIIIHLAGENIANGRWSNAYKQKILNSRTHSTQLLVDYINKSQQPPKLFICASAIGFYGDTGNQVVDESSDSGHQFVSEVAKRWEECSQQVTQTETRVINIRTGIVLSKKAGALQKMLLPFKCGVGGNIGNGQQMMSWIDIEDEVNAILFLMQQPSLSGVFNLVAPNPVSNAIFSQHLAKVLNRPCFFPLPSLMVKTLFGQMGEELLLSSNHVKPTRLQQAGFQFTYPTLEESLKHILSKK